MAFVTNAGPAPILPMKAFCWSSLAVAVGLFMGRISSERRFGLIKRSAELSGDEASVNAARPTC